MALETTAAPAPAADSSASALPNPVIPATFTPPAPERSAEPPAPEDRLDTNRGTADRGSELDRMFSRQPSAPAAPAAPETKPPVEEKPVAATPPAAATPAVPPVSKPPELKPNAETPPLVATSPAVTPPAAAKPPADASTEQLPSDILEGIPENPDPNHRKNNSNYAVMRKRLAQAAEQLAERDKKIGELSQGTAAAGTPPPDYEEAKRKAERVEGELNTTKSELEQTRERLYAFEVKERPEYQKSVAQPWAETLSLVDGICSRYGINTSEIWAAWRLPEDKRDAILADKMELMNRMDQTRFAAAMDRVPQISQAKQSFEATSKERLQAIRQQDQQTADRTRDDSIKKAVGAQGNHVKTRQERMPFIYHLDGDTPDVKQYNESAQKAADRAAEITRTGIDKLAPEVQGMMVHDALMFDHASRSFGLVLQGRDTRIQQLEKEATERETAFKQMESELNEYRSAVPGGGGSAAASKPGAAGGEDTTLDQRINGAATRFGWK